MLTDNSELSPYDILCRPQVKLAISKAEKTTIPVSPLFVPRRILVLDTEGTTRSNTLQVELRHVWHGEVDWTVVSKEEKRNISL